MKQYKMIGFWTDEKTYEMLEKVAEKYQNNKSYAIRQLIINEYNSD